MEPTLAPAFVKALRPWGSSHSAALAAKSSAYV
jgi:hypothetical protein